MPTRIETVLNVAGRPAMEGPLYTVEIQLQEGFKTFLRESTGELSLIFDNPISSQPSIFRSQFQIHPEEFACPTSRFVCIFKALCEISIDPRVADGLARYIGSYAMRKTRESGFLGFHLTAQTSVIEEEIIDEDLDEDIDDDDGDDHELIFQVHDVLNQPIDVPYYDEPTRTWDDLEYVELTIDDLDVLDATVDVDEDPEELYTVLWMSVEADQPVGHKGASASAMEELKNARFYLEDGDINDTEIGLCVVCLEEFSGGAAITRMPCSHIFHEKCVLTWLEESNSCPVCRQEIE